MRRIAKTRICWLELAPGKDWESGERRFRIRAVERYAQGRGIYTRYQARDRWKYATMRTLVEAKAFAWCEARCQLPYPIRRRRRKV